MNEATTTLTRTAVDHPQPGAVGLQAPLDQIRQQRLDHARVLAGALAQPQHMLVALGVDAQRNEDDAVGQVDAVDHHYRQIQPGDGTRQPFVQLPLAQRHEAPGHRALGGGVGRGAQHLGQLGLDAGVAARGHAGGHRLERCPVQRVALAGPHVAGQRQLASLQIAHALALHGDAPARQHHTGRRRAPAHRAATLLRHALGSAQRRAVLLHQLLQDGQPGLGAQALEGMSHIVQHTQQTQRTLLHQRVPAGSAKRVNIRRLGFDARLHVGGFLSLLARHPHVHMRAKGAATFGSDVQQIPGHRPAAASGRASSMSVFRTSR